MLYCFSGATFSHDKCLENKTTYSVTLRNTYITYHVYRDWANSLFSLIPGPHHDWRYEASDITKDNFSY